MPLATTPAASNVTPAAATPSTAQIADDASRKRPREEKGEEEGGSAANGEQGAAGATTSIGDIAPNPTIYIRNLNERVKLPELRKQLYNKFSEFGPILDVVAKKNIKMRGQAFIVFKDVESAAMAIKKADGAEFLDKPMVCC